MDHKVLLTKCITLLYKESLLKEPDYADRKLVEDVVKKIQPREIGISLGNEKDIVIGLKDAIYELLNTPHEQGVDVTAFLQRIRITAGDNDKLYQAIEKGLIEDQTGEELIKSIASARRIIQKHLNDLQVSELLSVASASWNYRRESIKDTSVFLNTMWSQLEPIASLKVVTDPAIVDEIRLGDKDQLSKVISDISVSYIENRVYKTGFQGLNRMLQGGFRPGDFILQGALQHSYKTGFSQTIFNQIVRYNKPMSQDSSKKPAGVIFAFEDKTTERIEFIYKQLKYTETREHVDISKVSKEEMQDYLLDKLKANGFEIFIYRVKPSYWTYKDIFNKITELEQKGYSIEFCLIDYLEKLPTTGCKQGGPMGDDLLDLFTRVRTFFNTKGIVCYSPHQLNPKAKELIRGTVTEDKFVQHLAGKGYYKGSSQLDQIPDIILLTHVFKRNDRTYLAVQRDRHRLSSIVEEKYKHFYLQFPIANPIPDDIETEDATLYKLPAFSGNAADSMFEF